MSGGAARRWLDFARAVARGPLPLPAAGVGPPLEIAPGQRAASLCIASGKGGTGKSVVSASLAALFAERAPTLLVDADMGIGNAHILQGVSPERSFVEVVGSGLSVLEVVTSCRANLDLVAAGSGVAHMASLDARELHAIAEGLELLELRYAHLLVDSAAGISEQTVSFAACCDLVLLVTTPDVTAMTDAYAFSKVLLRARADARVLLLVNRARDVSQAEAVALRIETVSQKFLGSAPRWIGWCPEDPAVQEAVNARAPVVLHQPSSPGARALHVLAQSVGAELARAPRAGLGRSLLGARPC